MTEFRTNFTRGYVVLYEQGCESWALLPAENLWDLTLRGILYAVGLIWCFLGIAIAADVFMSSIEVITSLEKKVVRNGETIKVRVWNLTIANLTLMAFGSSAPEILLAVIETISTLGSPPGELGPGTIVGSAAFNLLAISGICIIAVPKGEFRRLDQFGVFLVTAFFSVLAYVWLYLVLAVISPDEISLGEAIVTLILFPLLVLIAWFQDRNWFRHRKVGEPTHEPEQNVLELTVESPSGEQLEANRAEIATMIREIHKEHDFEDASAEDVDTEELSRKLALKWAEQHEDNIAHIDRLMYRMNAVRGISGRRRAMPVKLNTYLDNNKENENSIELAKEKASGSGVFMFSSNSYAVLESSGKITVKVVRTGEIKGSATVDYHTEHGTASNAEYKETSGTLTFAEGELSKIIEIPIIDDEKYKEDSDFYIVLANPSQGAHIKKGKGRATITIIDDDERSIIEFEKNKYEIIESGVAVELTVTRTNGVNGACTVEYYTEDGTAKIGTDYQETKGTLTFETGETSKTISVPIIDDDIPEDDVIFYVHLKNPSVGCQLGKYTKAKVTILDDDRINTVVEKIANIMKRRAAVFSVATSSWKDQFVNAMTLGGEIDELGEALPPSMFDMIMHALTFPWKILVAFVPPTDYFHGWLTFVFALAVIGFQTAIVGELAKLFGCVVGLKDTITAISFVALGTSLPDTFASKQAACESENADAAIGNVTGSNSVNVFLGLGLPWTIAAIYYAAKGEVYSVPAGDLGYSVGIFLICAGIGLFIITLRRFIPIFGGELGGNVILKWASGFCLFGLWVLYIALSALRAYDKI